MREGCVGSVAALPLAAKYEQAKDCRSDSEARNSPTRSVSKGHAQINFHKMMLLL